MITVSDARYDDVRDVMHEISDISLEEMRACGVEHAWHGLKRAKLCKDTGFLKVMRDGDVPLFIFGAAEMGIGVYRTWFIGAKNYFDPSNSRAMIASAKVMANVAKRNPHYKFEARTASKHPQVLRWFALLGFKYISRKDGMMLFRYVGRKLANTGNYAKLMS